MRYRSYERKYLTAMQLQNVDRLEKIGRLLKNEMKTSMRGKSPPPSAPGEIPHVATGTGRRSIEDEINVSEMLVRIGSNLVYMRHLELGTHKMAARPWIRPAVEKKRKEIEGLFK